MTTPSARSLLSLPLLLVALSLWFGCPSWADTLAWDANPPEEMVTGYVVWWGVESGVYPTSQDVGNVTEWEIPALSPPLWFAVTAYNGAWLSSDYSDEVLWTTGDPPPVDVPPLPACCGTVAWVEIPVEPPPTGGSVVCETAYLPSGAWLLSCPDVAAGDVWTVGY